MKPWEYYDNYIKMTLKAGDKTQDLEDLFFEIDVAGISPASEFACYVDAVIKQGVPEDNEKEVALQALLYFLCEHLGENFVEDEFEADSFPYLSKAKCCTQLLVLNTWNTAKAKGGFKKNTIYKKGTSPKFCPPPKGWKDK